MRLSATLVLLCASQGIPASHGSNQLAGHPSPYLALHANDPVHWRAWSSSAIEDARQGDKLLYVSVGYFSCHWCHVMQRESYKNEKTARILNTAFVPVKVDRELQPALDAYLIDFVKRTRGQAGWPLNVFITPEGHPLTGATYLPPDVFRSVLEKLRERWHSDKNALRRTAAQAAALMKPDEPDSAKPLTAADARDYRRNMLDQALAMADELAGGFGWTLKFPSVPQLVAMLNAHRAKPEPQLQEFLELTFEQMATQGLRDQLGGGFFRYTTDPNWQTPHFEKMLYDNALLVDAYLAAADALGKPEFLAVARDTADFMIEELRDAGGAFIASLSAVDQAGNEGGSYLWTREALRQTLTDEERTVARVTWGLQGEYPLEGGYLPVQAADTVETSARLKLSRERVLALRASARRKLLAQRSERPAPRDVKLLAAWNGLALGALARLARASGEAKYRQAAARVHDYLLHTLWDGRRLLRAKSPQGELGSASLEDYAYVAQGLLAWADLSRQEEDYRWAHRVIAEGWRRFHSDKGWRLADEPLIPHAGEETVLPDGPMPSPSAVLLDVTLSVAQHVDDKALLAKARQTLKKQSQAASESPFFYATHIDVLATQWARR